MNDHFVLKPIGALDLDRAARLHRDAFGPMGERPWTRQDMAELLAARNAGGLLLQIDGEDAGMALWRITADEAELLTIAVQAARRHRGAARALLRAVIERARQEGARKIFLEVGVDNDGARSLYSQAGFEEVGRRFHRARQEGARKIFLEVGVDNDGARSLYSQAGFEEVGRRSGYYTRPAGFADALVLRLVLSGDG